MEVKQSKAPCGDADTWSLSELSTPSAADNIAQKAHAHGVIEHRGISVTVINIHSATIPIQSLPMQSHRKMVLKTPP